MISAYVNIRRALVVSNGALILGCMILAPVPLYIGYVGFGMGVVLLVCFLMSAILSPILVVVVGQARRSRCSLEKSSDHCIARSVHRAGA